MKEFGGIDYESYARLIEWQISSGIDAIVAAGTTGEGSTLTDEEHRELLKFTVDKVKGRVPVIAGTGSNDIAYAVDLTKYACSIGADAMLVVSPYYNKATQGGLIKSFTAVADASDKPVILYNGSVTHRLQYTPGDLLCACRSSEYLRDKRSERKHFTDWQRQLSLQKEEWIFIQETTIR